MGESASDTELVVRTDTDGSGPAAFRAGLFCFGVAIAIVAGGYFWGGLPESLDKSSPDFNPVLPFVVVVAALLGTFFLVRAALHTLRHRQFGDSELRANEPRLGEVFSGVVRTSRNLAPLGDFKAHLRCDKAVRVKNISGGGYRQQTECLWESIVAMPAPARSSAGVAFEFAIPGDGFATGSHGDAGRISWTLEVTAPLRGVDYFAEFPIPMLGRHRGGTVTGRVKTPIGAVRPAHFAGQARPLQQWEKIAFPVALALGALLAAVGVYTTVLQISLSIGGIPASGHVLNAGKSVIDVSIDGSGPPPVTARVGIGTNFHRWQTGQVVRFVCHELGDKPVGCRMDTGGERWMDTTGALVIGLGLLAFAWRLWRRRTVVTSAA